MSFWLEHDLWMKKMKISMDQILGEWGCWQGVPCCSGSWVGLWVHSFTHPPPSPTLSPISHCPICLSIHPLISPSLRPSIHHILLFSMAAPGTGGTTEEKEHKLCMLTLRHAVVPSGVLGVLEHVLALHPSHPAALRSTWHIAHRILNVKTSTNFQSRKRVWFLQITNLWP